MIASALLIVSLAFAQSGDRPGRDMTEGVRQFLSSLYTHGPTFLIEYDNTPNDANFVHTVWRDLDADWGESSMSDEDEDDLLARHYRESAHHRGQGQ